MHVGLAYAVGCVGMLLEWRAYLMRSGYGFRQWSALSALVWSLMYCLLGAWTAAITMGVTALRTMASRWLTNHAYKHYFVIGFVLIFALITGFSWQGMSSLLPAFAVINTTLAVFYLPNHIMRIGLLLSSFAWIANDIVWLAWPALGAECVATSLNIYTIHNLLKRD